MQYIKTFTEYLAYFKAIAQDSTYFNFYQAGGAERIVSERLLSDQRSRVDSPLLFCEYPFIRINDYGTQNNLLRFSGAVVVLENPVKEDWLAQDVAMNDTLNALLQVISQMKIDNNSLNKRFLYFDLNSIVIDPIENLMIDSWFGWRCEFAIVSPVDIATDEACITQPSFWKRSDFAIS
jgi:hypothetical protein